MQVNIHKYLMFHDLDSDIFKSIKTSDEIQKKAPNNDYTQHRLNFTFLNVDTHKNLIENTSEIPTDINNIKVSLYI